MRESRKAFVRSEARHTRRLHLPCKKHDMHSSVQTQPCTKHIDYNAGIIRRELDGDHKLRKPRKMPERNARPVTFADPKYLAYPGMPWY